MGQAQLPPRADAHVRVADLDRPELSAEDAHHLESVLRLGSGRLVSATDGVGRWRLCVFCPSRPPRPPRLDPDGPIMTEPAPSYPVTVAVALTKADKPEWAVQRLTEAGVDRILLFEAARSVVRWDPAKAGAKRDRLAKVAGEASKQSRRVFWPAVIGPVPFGEMIAVLVGGGHAALAQPGGPGPGAGLAGVAVGPEGGWSEEELALTRTGQVGPLGEGTGCGHGEVGPPGAGITTVGLGPAVYRAETAALAAGVLLCALRQGLVSPALPGAPGVHGPAACPGVAFPPGFGPT